MSKRFLIMAGGTGGHVFPALATADVLRARGHEVTWLGSKGGMEERLLQDTGIPLHLLSIGGLRGKGLTTLLQAPLRLSRALWQAASVIRKVQPDCVLGMGGFASGPGGMMALLMRRPLAIHEQNAIPGMTNRWLAKRADRVLQAFPDTFSDKLQPWTVGNPLREDFSRVAEPSARNKGNGRLRLVVLGGSRGAQALNEIVPQAISLLPEQLRPEILHQAGQNKEADCKERYQQLEVVAQVQPFVADMADVYAHADLVICRAGALTVSEISAVGVASLLVPYPHAVDDHQTANAKFLEDLGAAKIIQQRELTPERLADELNVFFQHPEKLQAMARSALSTAAPDAARQVADVCLELAK